MTLLLGLGLILWWADRPWTWSLVDDPSYRLAAVRGDGLGGGVRAVAHLVVAGDWHRGIWRPVYWLYTTVLFQFGPNLLHAVRLAFLLVSFAAVLTVLGRRLDTRPISARWAIAVWIWGGCVLASQGDAWAQIRWDAQEVPGAAFFGLGLLARDRRLRMLCWLAAAWIRGPYSWVLVAWGLALFYESRGLDRDRRRRALIPAAIGIGNMILVFGWTLHGAAYTGKIGPSLSHLVPGLERAGSVLIWPLLMILAAVPLLRIDPRALLPRDATSRACYGGALLYLANLIPYGGGPSGRGYYFVGVGVLLCAGALTAVGADPRRLSAPTRGPLLIRRSAGILAVPLLATALVAPVAVTGIIATSHLRAIRVSDATVRASVRWLAGLPGDHLLVAVSGGEASNRFAELLALRGIPREKERFVWVGNDAPGGRPIDYYLHLWENGAGNRSYEVNRVADLGRATGWAPHLGRSGIGGGSHAPGSSPRVGERPSGTAVPAGNTDRDRTGIRSAAAGLFATWTPSPDAGRTPRERARPTRRRSAGTGRDADHARRRAGLT